jgi:hypothetical protein
MEGISCEETVEGLAGSVDTAESRIYRAQEESRAPLPEKDSRKERFLEQN